MVPYTNLKKTEEKNGEIAFRAEIPVEILKEHIAEALARIAGKFELPGFRKGKVPETLVREHVGEMELLETAADPALRDAVRAIADGEKLELVGKPQLTITKIAPQNPLEFTVRFALLPEVKLPDYKKIAEKIRTREESNEVSEKEMDEAVERIRGMIGGDINEESVKKLGPFTNVEEFKAQLKKQLSEEKKFVAQEAKRDEMVREIVKETKAKIPPMLIEQELSDFIEDRNEHLKEAGVTFEEYLKNINKTPEKFIEDERVLIEEQLKMNLAFKEIQKQENIEADEREVQVNIAHLKLRYPDQNESGLRRAAEAIAIQKKIFGLLEGTEVAPKES